MKKLLFLTFAFSGLSLLARAETQEFDLKSIAEVEVENASGNVRIIGVTSGKAAVTATKQEFGEHCKLIVERKKSKLLVEVKKVGIFKYTGNDACRVDFVMTVPKNVDLDVELGSGDLKVNNTVGELEFAVGSGSVVVHAEVKKLDGKVGSGDVRITGLTAGGSLKTGSGKIHLVYKAEPSRGELSLKTGSGDAEVILPNDAKIRTAFSAGVGTLTNELGDSADSKFKISMESGVGNLRIKRR